MGISGWIILDKPSGLFSRTVGGRIARMLGVKKFGHIGTLDSMASGVLPIAIGDATKMIPFVEDCVSSDKEYLFDMRFGVATDTLDIMGREIQRNDFIPTEAMVNTALTNLIGDIDQTPPAFSAVHVSGIRAYDLARRGHTVEIPPRRIHIFALEMLGVDGDIWHFRVRCSRGTYVRAIVRDIATMCGAIATTTMIRRVQTNGFKIKDTVKLDFLENLFNNDNDFKMFLKPVDYGLGDIPVCNLDDKSTEFYKNGGFVNVGGTDGLRRVYCGDVFVGIGTVSAGVLRPKRTI